LIDLLIDVPLAGLDPRPVDRFIALSARLDRGPFDVRETMNNPKAATSTRKAAAT
jgi:hypothetical protein